MARRIPILLVALLSGFLAGGCDPAPSVPLAPDKKMPDISKMSAKQVDDLLKQKAPDRH